jgi:hypothetical protein
MKVHTIRYSFFTLLLVLIISVPGYGQKNGQEDVIYLKDGSILKGEIQTYEQGGLLVLQLHGGQSLDVLDQDIQKIVRGVRKPRKERVNPLDQGQFYHGFYFSGNLGSNLYRDNDWGLGLEHVSGYWLTDQFGLGFGGGIIQYSADYSWRVAPVFVDIKLKSTKQSPFYLGGDIGLGFPIRNENSNIMGGRPGERVRLGIGKIWTLRSQSHLSMELSYLHQRTEFESRTWNWWSEDTLANNIRFKRYQLRLGFLF